MYHVLFCVIILLGVVKVEPINGEECHCGVPSDDIVSMRIVGGKKVAPHSFPWAVAILRMNSLHCGGALITDRHVLSAGHCFNGAILPIMKILAGLHNLHNLEAVESRTVSNALIHENFTSTQTRDDNDIAIATLSSPLRFGKTIKPICLPKPYQSFENFAGTIVGWGRQGEDEPASKVLLKATIKILSDEDCMRSELSEHLTCNMLCGFAKLSDGCQGDSGGPLQVIDTSGRYLQAGVTSWGIGCADPRYPGIYTKVSNFIGWIKKNTIGGITCK